MASQRIAIYGGNGFIGSHIAKQLSEHELCVLCLSRTGHKPTHLRSQCWSERVRWCMGDASEPNEKLLSSADVVICSVGSAPVPTFSAEAYASQVHNNGTVNANAIRAAGAAGVKTIVLISAKLPKFLQKDSFGYAKGKRISEEAALEFTQLSDQHQALILRPSTVYGTRYTTSGRAIPLDIWFGPFPKIFRSKFSGVDQIAARVADFITNPEDYSKGCNIITGRNIPLDNKASNGKDSSRDNKASSSKDSSSSK